jgi:alpha-D-ribose 1-methylphosphonate 5-triphosphate diphosphatase PhnM
MSEEEMTQYVIDKIRKGMAEALNHKVTKESLQTTRASMLMQYDDVTASMIKSVEEAGAVVGEVEMTAKFSYHRALGVWELVSLGAPLLHFDEPIRLNPPTIFRFTVDPSFWEGKHGEDDDA